MQNNINGYNVLTSLSAAGADISFANNKFSVTGGLVFDPRKVVSTSGIITTVAEVPQVDTLTITAAASTAYRISIVQVKPNGVVMSEVFNYTSLASGDTATTIGDKFRSMINQSNLEIVASGGATLILTANAGYPVFTSSVAGSVGTIAIVLTTAGVYAVNTYASLVANGVPSSSLTVGATYTSWNVVYEYSDGSVDKLLDQSQNQWTVYAQDGITNLSAFVAKLSLVNSYVNANPLKLQLNDTGLSAAINATATATAAQVSTGYITSTSGAATTITLPTGTLLGAQLGASAGTIFDLIIDNTAGASTVTVAVGANNIQSAYAAAEAGGAGLLTVPSGVTGIGVYRFMFSSATACCFTRVA